MTISVRHRFVILAPVSEITLEPIIEFSKEANKLFPLKNRSRFSPRRFFFI